MNAANDNKIRMEKILANWVAVEPMKFEDIQNPRVREYALKHDELPPYNIIRQWEIEERLICEGIINPGDILES